jgi:hypothetical protein
MAVNRSVAMRGMGNAQTGSDVRLLRRAVKDIRAIGDEQRGAEAGLSGFKTGA